jgi:hypothetical protein
LTLGRTPDGGILCRSRPRGDDPWRTAVFRYLRRIVARQRKGPDVSDRRAASARCGERGAPPPVPIHRVTVLLNQGEVYAHPGDGYEPLSGYVRAIDFDVEAISAVAACEVAYGVTNSYPTELHCDSRYIDVVRTYREVGHFRSVTVGDMFVVDEVRFVCSHFGFAKSPWMNGLV